MERGLVAGTGRSIASAGFIGEDGLGNAYWWVQVEATPAQAGDIELEAVKFSGEGELLSVLPLPDRDYSAMYSPKFVDVDNKGNLYQVVPGEKNLKVRIWTLARDFKYK